MSNHNTPNNHKPALSFRVWDTGDETSIAHSERLMVIVQNYQKTLANELGKAVSWEEAIHEYITMLSESFDNFLEDGMIEVKAHKGDAVLPDA